MTKFSPPFFQRQIFGSAKDPTSRAGYANAKDPTTIVGSAAATDSRVILGATATLPLAFANETGDDTHTGTEKG